MTKRKWCIVFGYRPPYNKYKSTFFSEINNLLENRTGTYENTIIAVDMNINFSDKKDSNNYLSDLRDNFFMKIFISGKTCAKSVKGTLIDVIPTNRSRSFHSVIETILSDCHKFFASFF